MISIFVKFLREKMGIPKEKIRMALILYPDLIDMQCKNFWSHAANLPNDHFMKSQYIHGNHPTKRLSHGICMIVVSSVYAKTKILAWIDIFSKQYTITS